MGIETFQTSEQQEQEITSLETTKLDEALEIAGIEQIPMILVPNDSEVEFVFSKNNPGLFGRFNIPEKNPDQPLKPTFVRKAKEYIAGIVPYVGIVSESAQRRLSEAFHSSGYASGEEIVEADGVIMQSNYRGNLSDVIGNRTLDYPQVSVHVYSREGNFERAVQIKFLTKQERSRLEDVNRRLMEEVFYDGSPFAAEYPRKFQNLYTTYKKDGLMERLITDEKSIGMIGTPKGLSLMDIHEILLNYRTERIWLEHMEKEGFSGLNISPEQKALLENRLNILREENAQQMERITPTQVEVLDHAIQLALYYSNPSLAERLRKQRDDYDDGLERYYHNIGRGGFLTKLNPREIRGGKQSHLALLRKIIEGSEDPALLPGRGTYTKGTYVQKVDYGVDDPNDLYGFLLEEYPEVEGTRKVSITELVKNMGSLPLVLDFATEPLPKFKHQTCAIRYTPTPLRKELRRVLVSTPEEQEEVQKMLRDNSFTNVDVILLDEWKEEVTILKHAQDQIYEKMKKRQ